jgi:hypothetical protein
MLPTAPRQDWSPLVRELCALLTWKDYCRLQSNKGDVM